jgi:acyl carrier protein
MTKTEFLRRLEESLEIDEGSLNGPRSLGELEYWDSMAALTFMALADEHLQVTVGGDQIVGCKTVADLLGLLGDKLTG